MKVAAPLFVELVVREATTYGPRRTQVLEVVGGAEGDRTPDLLIANEALSQLSYSPQQPVSGGENVPQGRRGYWLAGLLSSKPACVSVAAHPSKEQAPWQTAARPPFRPTPPPRRSGPIPRPSWRAAWSIAPARSRSTPPPARWLRVASAIRRVRC